VSALSAGPSPDHLLTQIRALLAQYLAQGSDTPVAPEAMQLADAIDQTTGGGDQTQLAGPGGPPDQAPLTSGASSMPDMTGGMDLSQQSSGGYKDFGSASKAAKGDISALLQGKKKKGSKGS
jgi:hypothetical protein